MKLLFLAPQPFFQERGTPIAVRLALDVIAQRQRANLTPERSQKIDVLTYHEGSDIDIPGVAVYRISPPKFLRRYLSNIGPGVSLKKLICDLFFLFSAIKMVWKQRLDRYEVVHAVEESVFIAMLIKLFTGIPYIYDMDSSLAMQVTEKWFVLKPLFPILRFFEKLAVRYSMAVAPVCDALGVIAKSHGARHTFVVRDISLINDSKSLEVIDLRNLLSIPDSELILLYVGNLEKYQGIDLLLESFSKLDINSLSARVVIIGGLPEHVQDYSQRVKELGLQGKVDLIGPRPVSELGDYIAQADILVSPRTKGNNTPMKIYSYLHSGKAVLATRLPTHTQVLDDQVSALAEPNTEDFSKVMQRLIIDDEWRKDLGLKAQLLAEEHYTFKSFSTELNRLYDQVGKEIIVLNGV